MGHNLIVGVFKEETQAESAIAVLKDVGFNNDQIEYSSHINKWMINHIFDNLVSMGVQQEEASYYKSELEAGRSIVLVKHDGRRSQTLAILLLNGAKNHKYLKVGEQADKEPPDIAASSKFGSSDQIEVSQDPQINGLTKIAPTRDHEPLTSDEMISLRKLLERSGLDHLL